MLTLKIATELRHDERAGCNVRRGGMALTVYASMQLKMVTAPPMTAIGSAFSLTCSRNSTSGYYPADEHPLVLEGVWDRDKLVLMSFPDAAAFDAWANSQDIGNFQRPQSERAGHRAAGKGTGIRLKLLVGKTALRACSNFALDS